MRVLDRYLLPDATETAAAIAQVRAMARPLDTDEDLDPLMERIGDSRYVLLGEASHGTAEYYLWRSRLSQRLIREKGFSFIAVEGDWPDCYRVNRFIKGADDEGHTAHQVLRTFQRWPTWMWANEEIAALVVWLRAHNDALDPHARVGFYGLDVYSLWDSMRAVLDYLERRGHGAAEQARRAFECFDPYGEDVQQYALATRWTPESCEDEVVSLLGDLRRIPPSFDEVEGEEHFNAEQNALVAQNAEHYYRTMVRGGAESWNVRDSHMVETLERLMRHHGPDAKAIIWEHNTHIGDARATDMARSGMVNVGQLVRERHAEAGVVLVGFGSHRGSVIAAPAWEAPSERMPVPPAREDSWEDVMHRAGEDDKLLILADADDTEALASSRGHRAIGVVYDPHYEAFGNYVPTVLPERYDAFLYIDRTEALHPMDLPAREDGEVPETFPVGV